jgi:hypothetical protein
MASGRRSFALTAAQTDELDRIAAAELAKAG